MSGNLIAWGKGTTVFKSSLSDSGKRSELGTTQPLEVYNELFQPQSSMERKLAVSFLKGLPRDVSLLV